MTKYIDEVKDLDDDVKFNLLIAKGFINHQRKTQMSIRQRQLQLIKYAQYLCIFAGVGYSVVLLLYLMPLICYLWG